MKRNKTIIIVLLLLVLIIINIVMIVKPNKIEIKEAKETYKTDKKTFAMYVENLEGTYEEYVSNNLFPVGYLLNKEKSSCVDLKGNNVLGSLTSSGTSVTVTTNKTVFCYLYFDRKENGNITLSETSGILAKGKTSTFTITSNLSGGTLSVVSENNNIATASLSGDTVTIKGVNEGSTTITVTSAETDEYLLAQVTYTITVKGPITFTINGISYNAEYGMTWNEWFISSYNTIGKTNGTIKDANGNQVAVTSVIVGGGAYNVTFPMPISDLSVGSSVYFKLNGVRTEFIVVHHGIPSSLYDSSCDGTWVLMKNSHSVTEAGSGTLNHYGWTSNLHTFFNNGFLNELEASVRNSIKTVKIPWVAGTGNYSVASGANGLSTRVFALSGYEVGFTQSHHSQLPIDGAILDYFKTGSRLSYFNGSSVHWWLRSPVLQNENFMWVITKDGTLGSLYADYTEGDLPAGRRPAFILPFNFDVTNYI